MAAMQETQGEWQGTTDVSHSPELPGVGEWHVCVATDPIYIEIAAYCAFRRALGKYIMGTWAGNVVGPRLTQPVTDALDWLDDEKDAYPTGRQLLEEPVRVLGGPIRYHTSYEVFSDSRPFSRSAMVAGFRPVMHKVTTTEPDFRVALHHSVHVIHTRDYDSLVTAYKTWHDMAVASIQAAGVVFAHVRRREERGPATGKGRFSHGLPLLLAELARFDV
jgi:hypothetical protein